MYNGSSKGHVYVELAELTEDGCWHDFFFFFYSQGGWITEYKLHGRGIKPKYKRGEKRLHTHGRKSPAHAWKVPSRDQNLGRWIRAGYFNHCAIPIFFQQKNPRKANARIIYKLRLTHRHPADPLFEHAGLPTINSTPQHLLASPPLFHKLT